LFLQGSGGNMAMGALGGAAAVVGPMLLCGVAYAVARARSVRGRGLLDVLLAVGGWERPWTPAVEYDVDSAWRLAGRTEVIR